MSTDPIAVLLFDNIYQVMKAEKVLQQTAIQFRLIPVPREISSNCGLCLSLSPGDTEIAQKHLQAARITITGAHVLNSK